MSSITNEINELENQNIFRLFNKKEDSYLNIINQKKNNLQNEEKKMEKNIEEYNNEYGKIMKVFKETEGFLTDYFVNKRNNEIKSKNNKELKVKIINKNKSEIEKFNHIIKNSLKYEEKFLDIHLSFEKNSSKYFESYDNDLKEIEKQIIKNFNYLNNSFISFSSIIFNSYSISSKNINELNEQFFIGNQNIKMEEEINENKEEEKEKENNFQIIQDFYLFKKKYFNKFERKYLKEKYKVKAIKITVLDDKLGKEKKAIINELNKEFGINDKLDDSPIILTEEDVYNITKTFYGPFQFVDKSEYDLVIEKKKIDIKNITNKLLYFCISQKKLEEFSDLNPIEDEEITILSDILKEKEYRMIFLQRLNYYRNIGIFGLPQKEFDIISKYFKLIADYIAEDENKDMQSTKFLLILSQTFFLNKENNEKYYLQKEIKGHKLFSDEKFWKEYIRNLINEEAEKLEKRKKSFKVASKGLSFNEIAFSKIFPFCENMNDFGMNKEILMHIIEPIYEEYNITQKMRESIDGIISSKEDKK